MKKKSSIVTKHNENIYEVLRLDGFNFAQYVTYHDEHKCSFHLDIDLIIYIRQGKKILFTETGSYELNQGDLMFLRSGNCIMSQVLPPREILYEALLFYVNDSFKKRMLVEHPNLFEGIKKNITIPRTYRLQGNPFIIGNIESMYPYFNYDHKNKEELLNLKFKELMINVLSLEDNTILKSYIKQCGDKSKLDLRYYMMENYAQPLSIADFATNTFRSLSTFKKDFKETFNTSPKAWVNNKRLERARMLISNSPGYNITEICFISGFNNLSHFIHLFKTKYGITPKQLQQEALAEI